MKCSVEGCEKPVKHRGWCAGHYSRWWKTGDVRAHEPIKPWSKDRSPCLVEDCTTPRYASNGYCVRHDAQIIAYGRILEHTTRELRKPIIEGEIARIPLGTNARQGYAVIDARMADAVCAHNWLRDATGYSRARINGNLILLHRFVMGLPEGIIDHINRNPLDSRLENLRVVSVQRNALNSKTPITNTSGYKGVGFYGGKWHARIQLYGRTRHIGSYDDLYLAHLARKAVDDSIEDILEIPMQHLDRTLRRVAMLNI